MDRPAALRPELARPDGQAGLAVEDALLRVPEAGVRDVVLDVGRGELGPRADEAVDDAGGERERALPGAGVFEDLAQQREAARLLVQCDRAVDALHGAADVMVLVILADARQRVQHLDAMLAQQLGPADAGQLEKLRRLHGAGGEQHLAPGARFPRAAVQVVGHADRPLAFEQDLLRMRAGLDRQVRAMAHRVQIGRGRAVAESALLRHLVIAEALLVGAVVIGIALESRVDRGIDDGVQQHVLPRHVGDVERTADAAILGDIVLAVLRLLEILQHVVV